MARRYSNETIARRKAQFLRAFTGWPAYQLARALGRLTHGVSWRGCSKGFMAEEWASSANLINRDIPLKALLRELRQLSGADHPPAARGRSKATAGVCPCSVCRSDLLSAAKHILTILRHPHRSVTVLDAERLEAAISEAAGKRPPGPAGTRRQVLERKEVFQARGGSAHG